MNDRDKLIHNERAKLLAMYLNGLAVAFAVAGAVTIPLTLSVSTALSAPARSVLWGVMTLWFVLSTVLHRCANRLLARLRP